MTKTTSRTYTMNELEQRQADEGFEFGYLGHEVRGAVGGKTIDEAVMRFLKEAGFDKDDAYQALNSRNGRHMGDALTGAAPSEMRERIIENLWPTPAAMYRDLGQTKEQLSSDPKPSLLETAKLALVAMDHFAGRRGGNAEFLRHQREALRAAIAREEAR